MFRLPRDIVNKLIKDFSESEYFEAEDGRLLGDKAYPCTRYLMTPYKDNGHLLPHRKKFDEELSKCRVDVEHTIGILKQRFRILYHMRLQPGMRRLKIKDIPWQLILVESHHSNCGVCFTSHL
ncbi:hypothetical protein QAD02_013045 [Eretmocerus hayati]|uniref:Uncharacterized protein n=1 Tax=Eretmocerus hayati TaxID=131215 RepID=A0ACC2P1A9_9HYME|nr:hypothetical protein QAD02_013045 [Eretmocerus hayati]